MIPPGPHTSTTLVLRRAFTASRQRVFRAWIDPEALASWLRPRGRAVTVRSLDVRVGGSFRFELENGGSIVGTYLRILPPEKLVFTWSGEFIQNRETIVTLDFLDQGPVTEVVLTHEGLSTPDLRALFASGWPSLFDALTSVLFPDLNDNALFG
ncbi:MAG TPA: SRPBCC domain-containing protein [Ktedonobacteraceae bacterium]|nr:SRPBCC domain-containing protein [Ktedonobacteraceae bacterium]